MNLRKSGSIILLSAIIAVASCRSSQELLEPKLSLRARPEFLNDIELGSNTTLITVAANNHNKTSTSKNTNNIPAVDVLQLKYASLLHVAPNTLTNVSLYGFIEDWYGVRYRMGGNDKNGIDCSAFAQRLYENVFCTNLVRTAMEQFTSCRFYKHQDSLTEGDLVFFKTRGRKRITHVGIYLANNFFVHASSKEGVMISSLNEEYWSKYYAGSGRLPNKKNEF